MREVTKMRRTYKQQAENFIKLLEQAHEEIKKFLKNKDYLSVKELLGQCQEGALELGGFIEKTEKPDIHIISLLEKYCELLYAVYEEIGREQSINADKIYKKLRQSMLKVENSLKNDIRTTYEIVFMPYKASMWDSLESVWKAAKEDSDCDVYVVPIPYYDKNSDQSFGALHYEGGDFPEDVPITHYAAYDLEKRRPDIVYIHNPYDENNYVTSVAPRFYAPELKEHTDCLAYIPYCVYEEKENPESDDTIAYCSRYITNGILYADKVILQSEKFRRIMINTLQTYCGMDRSYWENKVLGLGSPKYDRIFDTDRDIRHMPEEWKRLAIKPDGSRKKVVFYNTSLGALLQYSEQMLEKIQSVLRFFYEKREEYVLLWRPHPLVKATIESMRPELWEKYKEITDTYREAGWGIYDDTPDFHAAFALSDAYYGDYSSLVLLYRETGKPLLEQNVNITDYRTRLTTDILYFDGECLWGTAREFNGLFRIDPETYEVQYMGQFPGEKAEGYRLFWGIAECSGKLYFCPYNAKNIAVYDKKTAQFGTVFLREDIRDIDKKFARIMVGGEDIYLTGSRAYVVARLNTVTGEIRYIENWAEQLKGNKDRDFGYLIKSGCICKGEFYCLDAEGRGILHLEPNEGQYEYIQLDDSSDNGFSKIMCADGMLWLLPMKKGHIACFDLSAGELYKLEGTDQMQDFCRIGDDIFYFSLEKQALCRVHIESNDVTVYPVNDRMYSLCPVGNKVFMTTYATGELYLFHSDSGESVKTELFLNNKDFFTLKKENILEENKNHNKYAREFGFMNLKKLCELSGTINECQENSGECGERIHRYIKGMVR